MRALILASLLLGTTAAQADDRDLPENAVITNQLSDMTVYAVQGAEVTHDFSKVENADGRRYVKIAAALELKLNVEGNLCGASPNDVTIVSTPGSVATEANISLAHKFESDPFSDIMYGCLAYSAPRNVTVALKLSDYLFDSEQFERSFVVIAEETFGPSGRVPMRITVRHDDVAGWSTTTLPVTP